MKGRTSDIGILNIAELEFLLLYFMTYSNYDKRLKQNNMNKNSNNKS